MRCAAKGPGGPIFRRSGKLCRCLGAEEAGCADGGPSEHVAESKSKNHKKKDKKKPSGSCASALSFLSPPQASERLSVSALSALGGPDGECTSSGSICMWRSVCQTVPVLMPHECRKQSYAKVSGLRFRHTLTRLPQLAS